MSTTVTRPVTTTAAAGGGGTPTAAETALAYVREVRNRFERQPRTYEEFLNVMKDFKSGVCVPHLVSTDDEPTRCWVGETNGMRSRRGRKDERTNERRVTDDDA